MVSGVLGYILPAYVQPYWDQYIAKSTETHDDCSIQSDTVAGLAPATTIQGQVSASDERALTETDLKPESISELLEHFSGRSGQLPPSARVTEQVIQSVPPGRTITDAWRIGKIICTKLSDAAWTTTSHVLHGPRKKSWGLETSLAVGLMRGIGEASYTSLADVSTIRKVLQIGGLIPTGHSAVTTPVTFKVKRLALRGFLEPYDKAETGKRELTGNWVVSKKVWQRMQVDRSRVGSPSMSRCNSSQDTHSLKTGGNLIKNIPAPIESPKQTKIIFYLGGGAFYCQTFPLIIPVQLSKSLNARVFALNYRLAPETVFPGPVHDTVVSYFRLIDDLGIKPENIILAGDSAGGGLCCSLLIYLRDNNYPMPAGAILLSPWVDLTMSSQSWETATDDILPAPGPTDHMNPVACYLGPSGIKQYLAHPLASPLFADFSGLPPLLIQAGSEERLRDETTLLAHKAKRAGVKVTHEIYEDAIHVFHFWIHQAAAKTAFVSCANFAKSLSSPTASKCRSPTADAEILKAHNSAPASSIGTTASSVIRERSSSLASQLAPTLNRISFSNLRNTLSTLSISPIVSLTQEAPSAQALQPSTRSRANSHAHVRQLAEDFMSHNTGVTKIIPSSPG